MYISLVFKLHLDCMSCNFFVGCLAKKALTEERLVEAVRVDMEERLDVPNCQVTPLQACNL